MSAGGYKELTKALAPHRLQTECGFQFTSKLEGMFKDMRLSKELSSAYKAHRRKSKGGAGGAAGAGAGAVEVDVTVLTTGFWPAQAVSPCNLPPVVRWPEEVAVAAPSVMPS